MRLSPLRRDRYALYEAALQSVHFDLNFFLSVWRSRYGGRFLALREDFCGTAQLATEWVLRDPRHRAVAVDRDPEPLVWARRHRLDRLGDQARALMVVEGDVREVTRPRVDVVVAMNFSYWVFKQRDELRRYFDVVRRSLGRRGLLFVNAFGGTSAMETLTESRPIPASQGPDGLRIPGFRYIWRQTEFNPVTHDISCRIDFRFRDGNVMRNAFRYDWRFWTLPEIREVMLEAGFETAEVYVEGWDNETNRPKNEYRRRARFENQLGWLAIIVGAI